MRPAALLLALALALAAAQEEPPEVVESPVKRDEEVITHECNPVSLSLTLLYCTTLLSIPAEKTSLSSDAIDRISPPW